MQTSFCEFPSLLNSLCQLMDSDSNDVSTPQIAKLLSPHESTRKCKHKQQQIAESGNKEEMEGEEEGMSSSSSSSNNKSKNKNKKRKTGRLSVEPQSVAARQRRHRISERFKILQRMVPGGMKMDTASMLDEAILYVKFLQSQILFHHLSLLSSLPVNSQVFYSESFAHRLSLPANSTLSLPANSIPSFSGLNEQCVTSAAAANCVAACPYFAPNGHTSNRSSHFPF